MEEVQENLVHLLQQMELLILVAVVEELELTEDLIMVVLVVLESLLLDTNFKINMYLLNFKINI